MERESRAEEISLSDFFSSNFWTHDANRQVSNRFYDSFVYNTFLFFYHERKELFYSVIVVLK